MYAMWQVCALLSWVHVACSALLPRDSACCRGQMIIRWEAVVHVCMFTPRASSFLSAPVMIG
jgi:hypothetical protein